MLAGLIDRWKNRGWTPAEIDAAESEGFANGRGQQLYAAYQARLKAVNACDFGDLLLHMLVILKTHRDVLAMYQQRFKYILVDEYQDTNSQPVSVAPPARAGAQEHLLRRRRRPVDLLVARRGGRQHPAVREGFSRRRDHPAGTELPLHPAHPRRRVAA